MTVSCNAPTLDDFARVILAEDELGAVLRAHLVIEFHVDELLEVIAPNAAALPRMGLDYFGKMNVLELLGIAPNLTKPLTNLGNLRNSFAHKLNYTLTGDRINALYECFDSDGKQISMPHIRRCDERILSRITLRVCGLFLPRICLHF